MNDLISSSFVLHSDETKSLFNSQPHFCAKRANGGQPDKGTPHRNFDLVSVISARPATLIARWSCKRGAHLVRRPLSRQQGVRNLEMPIKSIIFGSIGTIVETSDIQRQAYNDAMREGGLNWNWDPAIYSELLLQSGGKDRLSHLAAATPTSLSPAIVDQLHARKTELACERMKKEGFRPRQGVAELINLAKERGLKLAFVITT